MDTTETPTEMSRRLQPLRRAVVALALAFAMLTGPTSALVPDRAENALSGPVAAAIGMPSPADAACSNPRQCDAQDGWTDSTDPAPGAEPKEPTYSCSNPRQCDGQDGWSGSEDNSTWAGAPVDGTLELGHKGDPVEAAQNNINRFLRTIGDSNFLDVDGFYGEGTAGKVRWVQDYLKITVDGRYGPGTRSAIADRIAQLTNPPTAPIPCENPRQCDQAGGWTSSDDNLTWAGAPLTGTLKVGHKGDPVTSAQTNINRFLVGIGDDQLISVDGYFGEGTAGKLRWVQNYLGISVDGKYGAETRDAISAHLGELSIAARPPSPQVQDEPTTTALLNNPDASLIDSIGHCMGVTVGIATTSSDGTGCLVADSEGRVVLLGSSYGAESWSEAFEFQLPDLADLPDITDREAMIAWLDGFTLSLVEGTLHTGPMWSNGTATELLGPMSCLGAGYSAGVGGSITLCSTNGVTMVTPEVTIGIDGPSGTVNQPNTVELGEIEDPLVKKLVRTALCFEAETVGVAAGEDVCGELISSGELVDLASQYYLGGAFAAD